MLRKLAVVGAVALLGATAAAAEASSGGSATASLSDASPGAQSVVLTIGLPSELRCGRLNARSLTVALPGAMHVPRSIAATAVHLDGRAVRSVQRDGSTIVVSLKYTQGVTCFSIVQGVAHLTFTRRAGLANPRRAGSYPFTVAAMPGGQVWGGTLAVHS